MFVIGWNELGKEPDMEPFYKEDYLEALKILSQEFSWLVLENEELADEALVAGQILETKRYNAQQINHMDYGFAHQVGDFIYWLRRDVTIVERP